MGKVSPLFLKKAVPTLYGQLKKLALNLSLDVENLKAFYKLLFLLMLEFSEPGVVDMVVYLNWVQTQAIRSDAALSVHHCNALHAVVAGVMYLITMISPTSGLQENTSQVLAVRKTSAPHLLPSELSDSKDGEVKSLMHPYIVDKTMLFVLDEEELLKSPEPKKTFGKQYSITLDRFYIVCIRAIRTRQFGP